MEAADPSISQESRTQFDPLGGRRAVAMKEVFYYEWTRCCDRFPYNYYNKVIRERSLAWALSTRIPATIGMPEDNASYPVNSPNPNPASELPIPTYCAAKFWGPLWDEASQKVVSDPFRKRSLFEERGERISRENKYPKDDRWNTPIYQYAPLESKDSIRLLRLEPGTDGRLEFGLEHTTLSSPCSDYEALSYSWGDRRPYNMIYSSEGAILIPGSLRESLWRIRRADRPRYVWADSVCINQSDNAEKGHQVRLMCEIYKSATSVLVWLGWAPLREAICAFSILSAVASGGTAAGQTVGQAHFEANEVSSAGIADLPSKDSPPPLDLDLWGCVANLFETAWFRRVWCIQEVAVAQSATIMWGDADMSWRWVGLAATRIRVHLYPILARYDMSGLFNAYLMYRLSQGDVGARHVVVSFLELLAMTCQFEASDPRDRVYGLLGLAAADADPEIGKPFLDPDYTLELGDVYRNVAVKVLEGKESLKLLSSVQHGSEIPLPSWVPRWDTVHTSILAQFSGQGKISPSADVHADYELVDEGKVLRARGICVGTVTQRFRLVTEMTLFGGRDSRKSKPDIAQRQGLVSLFHDEDEDPNNSKSSSILPSLLADPESRAYLCYTLTAGKDWQGQISYDHEQHLADFAAFLDESKETRGLGPGRPVGNAGRFVEAMRNVLQGRRLFYTGPGTQIGLGPGNLQKGDRICVLFGCPMPVCLRYEGGRCLLAGECYLHEFMQGQAVELWRTGKLRDEIFQIY